MKTAAEWFEEGMAAISLSRHADYHSEYVGDLEDAVAAFDEALGLEPDHLRALHERALALAQLGRHEAALDSFVAAAARAPDNPARLKVVKPQRADAARWKVMGRDTFAREDYLVGEFATRAAAEARVAELEARTAKTQDEALRDSFWLVPAP